MTPLRLEDDRPPSGSVELDEPLSGSPSEAAFGPPGPEQHAAAPDRAGRPPVDPSRTSVAAALAGAAAGFALGGPFDGWTAETIGAAAALAAGGYTARTFRLRRPAVAQMAALPGALLIAVMVTLPAGVALDRLPDLVVESLRSGGLTTPPIPFDPGWRVLVTLISILVTVSAATAAVALDRARVAVAVPGVVALTAIMLLPDGAEMVPVACALALTMAGLTVAHGIELARQGTGARGSFETRRLARAAVSTLALLAAVVAVSQFGFLFPASDSDRVVPPRRPEPPPPQRDRVLFRVSSSELVPWRVGVLDVYEDGAWKTPPYDPARLVDLAGRGVIADVAPLDAPGAVVRTERTLRLDVTLQDVEGRILPVPASPASVSGDLDRLRFDPRTQTLQTGGRQPRGTGYTVVAAAPPGTAELNAASAPNRAALAEFLRAPAPGPVAAQLLAEAAALDVPLYERLQLVRSTYYGTVIAAGAGVPVDVGPGRVDQLLQESEASPFEIVAGEALLARWVGVPARVGFGFYGGDVPAGGDGSVREVRPRHGATWLEAYFEGHGWVPILGRPPRARASFSDQQRESDPFVEATDELAARVYVPTAGRSLAPPYLLARYWLARVLPIVLGIVALVASMPAALKWLRSARRRRWARGLGPQARVAVAYAEVRDLASDLNIGHSALTPLEFLNAVEPDVEHRELAWLVTRILWGDLQRDVREEDAAAAEEVARSFRRRLRGGQPLPMRVLGAVSPASLRDPWDAVVPNLWVAGRRLRLPRVPPLRFLVPVATAATTALMIALTGGLAEIDLRTLGNGRLPAVPELPGHRISPLAGAGEVFASYDADGRSLVEVGGFFVVREGGRDGLAVGTLEAVAFKPGVRARSDELRGGILRELLIDPGSAFRLAGERVYVKRVPEQTLYLWLAPDLSTMQLLVARREFTQSDAAFAALLAIQRGEDVSALQRPADAPPFDPRRGVP